MRSDDFQIPHYIDFRYAELPAHFEGGKGADAYQVVHGFCADAEQIADLPGVHDVGVFFEHGAVQLV